MWKILVGKNHEHQPSIFIIWGDFVRNLGIFIISLIQKSNISRFVTAYMCMCIFVMNTTACRDDILVNTVKTQSTEITEIRLYPAEGPMPRASEAPFAQDIVRCLKSWTTVDAGRCSQYSPTNGHQEEDTLLFHEWSPGRRRLRHERAVTESLPKSLIAAHPVQGS